MSEPIVVGMFFFFDPQPYLDLPACIQFPPLRIAFWGSCACFLPTAFFRSIWVLSEISPNLQAKIPDQQAKTPDQQANIPDRGANKYDRRRFLALKAFFHTKGKKHMFFGQRLKFWTPGRSRYGHRHRMHVTNCEALCEAW